MGDIGRRRGEHLSRLEYLVYSGCIPPLCDLLNVADAKIVTVALEGLENILKVGESKMRDLGLPDPHAENISRWARPY